MRQCPTSTARWIGRAALAIAAAAAIAPPEALAQQRFRFDATPGRLSKEVVPLTYRIAFDLDPARDTFDGRAEIVVRVRKAVDAIELHAHELAAVEARLATGRTRRALAVAPEPAAQTWRLVPADGAAIAAGTHRLMISYTGQVQRQGSGLFRAVAMVDGQRQPTLATQLEAIHARQVFPAFDEPAFRARFDVVVRAPTGYEVLANMPRIRREERGGAATHVFATTPPMPSYLVALAVGRYDVLEGRAAGVPLRTANSSRSRSTGSASPRSASNSRSPLRWSADASGINTSRTALRGIA